MTRRLRHTRRVERLALLGSLLALFGELHPLYDQWGQASRDAQCKGMHGDHLVHDDGTPADGTRPRSQLVTASQLGRRSAARHAATYTAGQLVAAAAVTRACGYRVPAGPLLVGGAITAVTHAVIDRRRLLLRCASKFGKGTYVENFGAVRMEENGTLRVDLSGPGTALFELDQAAHRAFGVIAAVAVTCLAVREKATADTPGAVAQ